MGPMGEFPFPRSLGAQEPRLAPSDGALKLAAEDWLVD